MFVLRAGATEVPTGVRANRHPFDADAPPETVHWNPSTLAGTAGTHEPITAIIEATTRPFAGELTRSVPWT